MSDSRSDARLGLRLTPRGHLLVEPSAGGAELDLPVATRLTQASAHGSGDLLLQLSGG
jgi:hypothetical protein